MKSVKSAYLDMLIENISNFPNGEKFKDFNEAVHEFTKNGYYIIERFRGSGVIMSNGVDKYHLHTFSKEGEYTKV